MEGEGGSRCEQDVRRRARRRDEDHVAAGVMERMKIDRHGLCVSEQKWRAQQQQDCRQQDRAQGVDVLQRIKGYATQAIRGVIAEAMGNEAVGGFVKCDGEKDGQHPDRGRVKASNCTGNLLSDVVCSAAFRRGCGGEPAGH
jgi:hypothetical protein